MNSAGLSADEVANMLGSPAAENRIYPVRGEVCELQRSRQDWIRGLVYPLPHPEGVSHSHRFHTRDSACRDHNKSGPLVIFGTVSASLRTRSARS